MKCQNLFSWKNKKNIISVSSAELTQRLVMVKKVLFENKKLNMKYIRLAN